MNRALLLLVLAYVGLGTYYSVTTPILETPDEVWHYQFIREIAVNHGLPVVNAEIKQPFAHEGLQPPLYYAAGAPLIAWMNPRDLGNLPASNPFALIGEPAFATNDNRNAFLHTSAEAFPYSGAALAIHLLRLYSVLLGAATVVFTYLLAREILPSADTRLAILAAAFVAFLPQFLFIGGAISNDNLATALSAASVWQLARLMRRGLDARTAFGLGLFVSGALLSKLSTIAIVPLVILVIVYLAWQNRAWRPGLKVGLVFLSVVALLAGWWFLRNRLLYGEFVPFTELSELVGARPTPTDPWRWVSAEGEGLRLSTWGVFGWFNILASPAFYLFYDALAALGLIGMGYALARRRNLSLRMAVLPIWVGLCIVALGRYSSEIVSTQGRLLFPALSAWGVLWAWGLAALAPQRLRLWGSRALGAALFASAAIAPALFIAPAYTPTLVQENRLPANWTPLNWQFDNGVEWLGASLDQTAVRAGDSLTATIYERVPASPPPSALFIHLVNSSEVIVAQRDSLLGGGNLNALRTPALVADTYRVSIPITAPAPDEWRVEAGMYDPASGKRFSAYDSSGAALGNALTLTTLRAQASGKLWNFDFDGRATLEGAELPEDSIRPGASLRITLNWSAAAKGYHVFVHLLGAQDHIWGAADRALDGSRAMQLELPVDEATPPGVYPLEVGVYQAPDGDRLEVFDTQGQDVGDRLFLGPVRVTP